MGRVKSNLADTIANQQKEINELPGLSDMQMASAAVTASILGAKGGSVRFLDNNGDGMPDTIYIADNPDPALAVKVWRFNYEGWGASKNGYNGPFVMGATLDEGILAEAITAARLVAGTIQSADGGKTLFIDLDNGIFRANGGTLSYTAMAYLPPTKEDLTNILWSTSFPDLYPPEDTYDLDGDGEFTINDFVYAQQVYVGRRELSSCPGAVATEATVTIDPSNPDKTILITGTNMWGSKIEIYYGVNGTNVPAVKGNFSVAGNLNLAGALIGGTGILYDTLPAVEDLEEGQIVLVKVPTATTEEAADG